MSRRCIPPSCQAVSRYPDAGLFRIIALFFLLSMALLLPLGAFAQNADVPSRSEIQSQIDALNEQKSLTPIKKLSQQEQDLSRTLELLDAIDRTRQEVNQLKQQVQQAPAKLQWVTRQLDELKNPANEAVTRAELLPLSLRQLESRLYQTLDDLQDAQESLSTFNSQLIALQTQPERVQSSMYNAS